MSVEKGSLFPMALPDGREYTTQDAIRDALLLIEARDTYFSRWLLMAAIGLEPPNDVQLLADALPLVRDVIEDFDALVDGMVERFRDERLDIFDDSDLPDEYVKGVVDEDTRWYQAYLNQLMRLASQH